MSQDIGYVYVILHKYTHLYKIGRTTNQSRRFKELEVGNLTKLIKSYRVFNHKEVERECHYIFKKKRLPQTEYFNLDKKELEILFKFLEENKVKTKKILKKERDQEIINKLINDRQKYNKANNFGKFGMRHENALKGAFGCGMFTLLTIPITSGIIMILNAYNLGWLIIFPFIFFAYFVGKEAMEQDFYVREDLLGEEEEVIKNKIEIWKSIDKTVGEEDWD